MILSSHVIEELEPICDEIMVINDGRILVHEDIDILKATHAFIQGPISILNLFDPTDIVLRDDVSEVGLHLIANRYTYANASVEFQPATLKEIVLSYLDQSAPADWTVPA